MRPLVPVFFAAAAMLCAQATKLPADIDPQSLSRLPLLSKGQLDADGQRIFEAVNGKEGDKPRLGPPNNSMYSIGVSEPFDRLNVLLRKTVAGPQMFEICTLIAAREFDQQYEWTGHEVAAQRVKVDQSIIDAIKFNRPVVGLPEKEATLITFGRHLFRQHKIESAEFAKMTELFGRQGTVDLIIAMGDYAMTALLLNAVDQRLPADRKALLPEK